VKPMEAGRNWSRRTAQNCSPVICGETAGRTKPRNGRTRPERERGRQVFYANAEREARQKRTAGRQAAGTAEFAGRRRRRRRGGENGAGRQV